MRFELIPEESRSTMTGDHLNVYRIINAPEGTDDISIIQAFLKSDAYLFKIPYGTFRVDRDENDVPDRLRWSYDTSG